MSYKGDIQVGRTISAGRRLNEGFSAETISTQRNITVNDYKLLRISNATTQDVVLADATTLPNGWSVIIDVPSASGASVNVKTYDAVTPVLLKNIINGRAYEFTLLDNSTDEGVWLVNFLEEADTIPSERYISTFNATTDWGSASGGYYTITVAQTTHERGVNPVVKLQELDGADYNEVFADQLKVLANGDTAIRVTEIPDMRFAGRAVFI